MANQNLQTLYSISKQLDLLYVEDDVTLQQKNSAILQELFKQVDCCDDGKQGLEQYRKYFERNGKYYDLVITDIKMPVMDGVRFTRLLHDINPQQKVIVTSAYDDSEYLIDFIDIGIEKFIKKPFSFDNLINTLLSLMQNDLTSICYLSDNIFWDHQKKALFKEEKELTLSNSELQVFKLFINNPNQVFSKYDLLNLLHEDDMDMEISDDAIKSIIKRLRKKLPEGLIENIYGKGYKLKK